jgi:hypothetical protein
MKNWFLALVTISTLFFVSCEKYNFDKPDGSGGGGNPGTGTDTVYTEVKAEFIKDCTGSYLRIDNTDYKVCNVENTANYENNDVIYASISKLAECNNVNPDQITCKMAHAFATHIKVRKSELLYRPTKELKISDQKMKVVKDCSGTYVQYENADYQVCNKDILAKYNDGDWIVASFYTLNECTEKKDEVICMLYHENKGWVKVFDIQ